MKFEKQYQDVFDVPMAYVDVGKGDPIVFLHGNPTSSYLWRNIIPYAQSHGRCIAPDLVGMGDSGKLPNSGPNAYAFVEQRRYLDALLEKLGVHRNVVFVVHDWGAALGFDWAVRHPGAVKGIAYMEAIIRPRSWDDIPEPGRTIFRNLRSPEGEKMVLEQNSFIEVNLPLTIMRTLSEEEMSEYRRPFFEPGEGRRPMLGWARQLPFDGEPADVTEIVNTYGEWLAHSDIPKLFVRAVPGTLPPAHVDFCRTWPAQREVAVQGRHYPQEDAPDDVGAALEAWLKELGQP